MAVHSLQRCLVRLGKIPAERQGIAPKDASLVLGVRLERVRALLDEGILLSFSISPNRPPNGRDHVRINRFSIAAYILERMSTKQIEPKPPFQTNRWVEWWRTELRKRPNALK